MRFDRKVLKLIPTPRLKHIFAFAAAATLIILAAYLIFTGIFLKDDLYNTSLIVRSNRRTIQEEKVEKIEQIRYDPVKQEFNTGGKGEEIYEGSSSSFFCVNMVFCIKDEKTVKSFEGRTINSSDKRMLRAIETHFLHKNVKDYRLTRDWKDNERRIIVSRHLLKRLGYKKNIPVWIKYSEEVAFQDKTHLVEVPLFVLGVVDELTFGYFVISEEFNYNINQKTLAPFDMVERFNVYCPYHKQMELKKFVEGKFKCRDDVTKISAYPADNRILYEVVFKNVPFYKKDEFKRLREEASKYNIVKQFEGSDFECEIDYFDWKTAPKEFRYIPPDFLTLYLRKKFVKRLNDFNLFLKESVGGVKIESSFLDTRRF